MIENLVLAVLAGQASTLAALGALYYKVGQNGARADAVADRVTKLERKLGWTG